MFNGSFNCIFNVFLFFVCKVKVVGLIENCWSGFLVFCKDCRLDFFFEEVYDGFFVSDRILFCDWLIVFVLILRDFVLLIMEELIFLLFILIGWKLMFWIF